MRFCGADVLSETFECHTDHVGKRSMKVTRYIANTDETTWKVWRTPTYLDFFLVIVVLGFLIIEIEETEKYTKFPFTMKKG